MLRWSGLGVVAGLVGCGGVPADSDSTDGACGAVTTHDLVVLGRVILSSGAAAGGATVELVDEGWEPGTVVGVTTAQSTGAFSLDAIAVTSVEGCWGSLLDYRLVAERDGATGTLGVNQALYAAITDETFQADVSASPITVQ